MIKQREMKGRLTQGGIHIDELSIGVNQYKQERILILTVGVGKRQ